MCDDGERSDSETRYDAKCHVVTSRHAERAILLSTSLEVTIRLAMCCVYTRMSGADNACNDIVTGFMIARGQR